jgi:uncharacterized protein (DUF58 family)
VTALSWRAVADRIRSAGREGRAQARRDDELEPILDEASLRQLMRIRLESGRSFTAWLTGERAGRRKMQAVEFEDYRGYVPGDDFRLIDWHAYARLGDLFVKTSLSDETVSVSLLVDCSNSMDWGAPTKFRHAKRLAATLGALALMHGDRVRVFGLGDDTALPGSSLYGQSGLTTLSADLEALPVFGGTDLRGSVATFQRLAEPYGVVILFSDLLVPLDDIEALDTLHLEGRTLVVIHIVDPAEAAPTLQGAVELRDSETGAVSLVSITAGVRRQYAARFQERMAAIEKRVSTGDTRYVRASTTVSPIDFLVNDLRREGVVAQT